MKTISILIFTFFLGMSGVPVLKSQTVRNFPIDPYIILKSWDYDFLIKSMGEGEEVVATSKSQTYLAGLRYPSSMLGMNGKLEFTFGKQNIERVQFRVAHEFRVTTASASANRKLDPSLSPENRLAIQRLDSLQKRDSLSRDHAIQRLDSLQKRDSLSRDSVVRAISEILGPPLSNTRTPVTEKNARHSAFWINRGYSCLYKDYSNYSEIVFTRSTIPALIAGEFEISVNTEILQKTRVTTKKMSWTASILGLPSDDTEMAYSELFFLVEISSVEKYLLSIPRNPISFMVTPVTLEFAGGQRANMSLPRNAIGFLPSMDYTDFNGDAIPEAWIRIPADPEGRLSRHYIYSLQAKDPFLLLSSEDLMPAGATIPDGWAFNPKGFLYLRTTNNNSDGSVNLSGAIESDPAREISGRGILEMEFRHAAGEWVTGQIKLIRKD